MYSNFYILHDGIYSPMLTVSMTLLMILAGVFIVRSIKASNIMPDVENFILKSGVLGGVVGIMILHVMMTILNTNYMSAFGTLGIIYLGVCTINTAINIYHEYKINKKHALQSIIIG